MTWITIAIIFVVCGFVIYDKFGKLPPRAVKAAPDLSILPEQFIVLDVETTGLDPEKHEIIEIAAIKVNRDSDNHKTWSSLIKPKKKIPKKITEITGITQEMVEKDGGTLQEAITELHDFIGDLRIVAYNAPFDMAFLNNAAKQFDLKINNPVSCALDMSRRAWPGLRSYSLKNLAKQAYFDTSGMHRALADSRITVTAYSAAATELRSVN